MLIFIGLSIMLLSAARCLIGSAFSPPCTTTLIKRKGSLGMKKTTAFCFANFGEIFKRKAVKISGK